LDKQLDEFVGLAESDSIETAKCETLSKIKSLKKVRNNLGGIGPDEGEEGMIYHAVFHMKDESGIEIAKKVTVAVHAMSAYVQKDKTFNGLRGKFLSILMEAHQNLTFKISVKDTDTNEPLVLPYFSISFFDLDMSKKKGSAEYVIAHGFDHYYVAKGARVNITDVGDGKKFMAAEIGTYKDNPEESEALDLLNKAKGVTLQYTLRDSAEFTVGAEEDLDLQTIDDTDDPDKRGFIFTLRPSILCAKTRVGGELVDPMNTSIDGVDLPLLDGKDPITGMRIPTGLQMTMPEDGTVIILKSDGSNYTINATEVIEIGNGTVIIHEQGNGTVIIPHGTMTDKNGIVTITEKGGDTKGNKDKGNANPKSGTKALLMVAALLAVVWPLGNLQ
jgi:hypothetical protein